MERQELRRPVKISTRLVVAWCPKSRLAHLIDPDVGWPRIREAVERALAIDPQLAEAHVRAAQFLRIPVIARRRPGIGNGCWSWDRVIRWCYRLQAAPQLIAGSSMRHSRGSLLHRRVSNVLKGWRSSIARRRQQRTLTPQCGSLLRCRQWTLPRILRKHTRFAATPTNRSTGFR